MLIPIIFLGVLLIILERIFPDRKLPKVKGWWIRVVIVNLFQLGIIFLGKVTWDIWFLDWRVFQFNTLPSFFGGFLGYILITFIFYWWHRFRHESNRLWLLFHQLHHSPRRIETITSFYKHPLEIICNSLIIGSVIYLGLGLDLNSAAWCLFYSAMGEYFYHMNIKTPHWIGYFFQRPEMHRIHHQRGKHYKNFSDLPLWDMLFGTYENPPTYQGLCGFKPEREKKTWAIFGFKNVNDSYTKAKERNDEG